jgi:N-acetylglutamate synthase-like GNAT family acetyltransferase
VETIVDAAVIRSLAVAQAMRRRGIGAALVGAARKAAHTRGARKLYALGRRGQHGVGEDYLLRFGFERVASAAMIEDLEGTFTASYLRDHPERLARIDALRLDISRDGVIER